MSFPEAMLIFYWYNVLSEACNQQRICKADRSEICQYEFACNTGFDDFRHWMIHVPDTKKDINIYCFIEYVCQKVCIN